MIAERDNQGLLDLYRLMRVTRVLDDTLGAHDGHWHGLEGEEATVAGIYCGLRRTDTVAAHYRGMVSAAYAKGADLHTLLAGCLGKRTAYHKDRHRSDICGPPEFNIIGLYSGSLGPPLGYATGAALAAQLDGRDDVAVGVFGDGSSSRGDCHEAMNMASVMNLPVIFVCQNNQIAISTRLKQGVGGALAARGSALGMPGIQVDGNDVLAVYETMQTAIGRARRGEGPSMIECLTYRVAGHFYSDAEEYRDAAEVEAWRNRDPISAYRTYLETEEIAPASLLDAIDEEVAVEVASAWNKAKSDTAPGVAELAADRVYA